MVKRIEKVVQSGVQGGGGEAVLGRRSQHGQIARDLDLTGTALRSWVRQAEINDVNGPPEALTTSERNVLEVSRSGYYAWAKRKTPPLKGGYEARR